MSRQVKEFVDYVLCAANVKYTNVEIIDFDCDRVYLAIDSIENNYMIRMWNVNEYGIRYSLFEYGEVVKEIIESQYYEMPLES